ncbi:hypothetical protein INR49_015865 [Caranx melampygus]|nr:hypothetical protein INR49_015865 [Caranx melampygus]
MHDHLLSAISCLCVLFTGLHAEGCSQGVLAKRNTFNVLEGDSLSLSCVILHCGHNWTGDWMWKNSTDEKFSIVEESDRHRLTEEEVSANETRLFLKLMRVSPLDEGSYKCRLVWGQDRTEMGHLTSVNVTAATPRNWWHRVLICAGASLCLPLILGFAYCLSSRDRQSKPHPRTQPTHVAEYRDQPHPTPQPLPRRKVPQKSSTSSQKACPKPQQKTEVVYADISKEALRQAAAPREPAESTVYSSVMIKVPV